MKCKFQDSDHLSVPCPHISRCHSFDPVAANVHYVKQPTSPTYNYDRGICLLIIIITFFSDLDQ